MQESAPGDSQQTIVLLPQLEAEEFREPESESSDRFRVTAQAAAVDCQIQQAQSGAADGQQGLQGEPAEQGTPQVQCLPPQSDKAGAQPQQQTAAGSSAGAQQAPSCPAEQPQQPQGDAGSPSAVQLQFASPQQQQRMTPQAAADSQQGNMPAAAAAAVDDDARGGRAAPAAQGPLDAAALPSQRQSAAPAIGPVAVLPPKHTAAEQVQQLGAASCKGEVGEALDSEGGLLEQQGALLPGVEQAGTSSEPGSPHQGTATIPVSAAAASSDSAAPQADTASAATSSAPQGGAAPAATTSSSQPGTVLNKGLLRSRSTPVRPPKLESFDKMMGRQSKKPHHVSLHPGQHAHKHSLPQWLAFPLGGMRLQAETVAAVEPKGGSVRVRRMSTDTDSGVASEYFRSSYTPSRGGTSCHGINGRARKA